MTPALLLSLQVFGFRNGGGFGKSKGGEITNDLYAFLTAEPNKEVGAVHPKALAVILVKSEEGETRRIADRSMAAMP